MKTSKLYAIIAAMFFITSWICGGLNADYTNCFVLGIMSLILIVLSLILRRKNL